MYSVENIMKFLNDNKQYIIPNHDLEKGKYYYEMGIKHKDMFDFDALEERNDCIYV